MFAEDWSAAFDVATGHAVAATFDGVTTVYVIHDREYVNTLGMHSTDPVAVGLAADFPSPVGKTLAIGAATFRIRSAEPIDDGLFVLLQLEAQ